MNSINKKLCRYLSTSLSLLLILILLATDITVDLWVSKEFDRAMLNKANLLITLVSEDVDEIEFDFADEFMPEFSGVNDPEYFQLWYKNESFERSKTLDFFETNEWPKLDVPLHQSTIADITLPDGRLGKMIVSRFLPQIDSDLREEFGIEKEVLLKSQSPMTLAYAVSNEGLSQIQFFVDVIFVLASIFSVIVTRLIVGKIVKRGLSPLDRLNEEIKQVNLNSDIDSISTDSLPEELVAVANGINYFLRENKDLYSREKRITSDIAHELKTPISELIVLCDIAILFPQDKELSDSFATDVLEVSERLKTIVNDILLLQKSSSPAALIKQDVDIGTLIGTIVLRENKKCREVSLTIDPSIKTVSVNEFAFDIVLTNLVSNALHYSPTDSAVSVLVEPPVNTGQLKLSVSNVSSCQYSDADLEHFFEPLWQKDSSRTSSDRYGLGLAIVKSYCDNLGASVTVNMKQNNTIFFTVSL